MRTNLKDINYFRGYIRNAQSAIETDITWLKEGKVNDNQKNWFKKEILSQYIKAVVACYSAGESLQEVKRMYIKALHYVPEGWTKVMLEGSEKPHQYILSVYDEVLWMLSLGLLIDIPDNDYKLLTEAIDRDGVKDLLFETIIKSKLPSRKVIYEDSYDDDKVSTRVFALLRRAVETTNKAESTLLIQQFLKKDWYKNHKGVAWYDNHKSRHNTFFGYWSFESAAIVKLKGLNNDDFKDFPYYPNDLL